MVPITLIGGFITAIGFGVLGITFKKRIFIVLAAIVVVLTVFYVVLSILVNSPLWTM